MVCNGYECIRASLPVNIETSDDGKEITYVGSRVTKDGRSKKGIRAKIRQAKSVFNKKKHLFSSNNISWTTRK